MFERLRRCRPSGRRPWEGDGVRGLDRSRWRDNVAPPAPPPPPTPPPLSGESRGRRAWWSWMGDNRGGVHSCLEAELMRCHSFACLRDRPRRRSAAGVGSAAARRPRPWWSVPFSAARRAHEDAEDTDEVDIGGGGYTLSTVDRGGGGGIPP